MWRNIISSTLTTLFYFPALNFRAGVKVVNQIQDWNNLIYSSADYTICSGSGLLNGVCFCKSFCNHGNAYHWQLLYISVCHHPTAISSDSLLHNGPLPLPALTCQSPFRNTCRSTVSDFPTWVPADGDRQHRPINQWSLCIPSCLLILVRFCSRNWTRTKIKWCIIWSGPSKPECSCENMFYWEMSRLSRWRSDHMCWDQYAACSPRTGKNG